MYSVTRRYAGQSGVEGVSDHETNVVVASVGTFRLHYIRGSIENRNACGGYLLDAQSCQRGSDAQCDMEGRSEDV